MDFDALTRKLTMMVSEIEERLSMIEASTTPTTSTGVTEGTTPTTSTGVTEGTTPKRSKPTPPQLELTLFEWFLKWEKASSDNKLKIKRAFKTQLMAGILQSGHFIRGYSKFVNRKREVVSMFGKRPYDEIKKDLFPKIKSKAPYKDMYDISQWDLWNYYLTGESLKSIFKSKYTIHSLDKIMFDRDSTLFADKKIKRRVLIKKSQFGLSKKSIQYLIDKYVLPYVKKNNGIIKEVDRSDTFKKVSFSGEDYPF